MDVVTVAKYPIPILLKYAIASPTKKVKNLDISNLNTCIKMGNIASTSGVSLTTIIGWSDK